MILNNTYVACFWICEAEHANFLCSLSREPGAAWLLQLNVRRFVDEAIFNSKDQRVQQAVHVPVDAEAAAEAAAVAYCEERLRLLAMAVLGPTRGPLQRIDVKGGVRKAAAELDKHPSIHTQTTKGGSA